MTQILGAALPGIALLTLSDFPAAPDVDEVGATFAENARLKARSAASHTRLVAIADDGGLCVDYLGGAPGVHSHRFLGADTPFAEKMRRILETMRDVPDEQRTCRFQCAVAIATPEGELFDCTGVCEGRIAREPRGDRGFGYDPIFYVPSLERHMAELTPDEKHRISHRGMALACAVERLTALLA